MLNRRGRLSIAMPRKHSTNDTARLFEAPAPVAVVPNPKVPQEPVWTESKARLVARYLYGFELVAKHGCYIDGFAAPQRPGRPESWSAQQVLEIQPPWFRSFHLFDHDPMRFPHLERLKAEHPGRNVYLYLEDFNDGVHDLLRPELIGPRTATFCLIDQRTTECRSSTIEALAAYKPRMKIELFYFLANYWLARTLRSRSTARARAECSAWWGRSDWTKLPDMHGPDRAMLLARRFKDELGYASAVPWPIYGRRSGGAVMYYMVHATDHPRGPQLMRDAYEQSAAPRPTLEQLALRLKLPPPAR
jgi:three-Cys-motif partner protein